MLLRRRSLPLAARHRRGFHPPRRSASPSSPRRCGLTLRPKQPRDAAHRGRREHEVRRKQQVRRGQQKRETNDRASHIAPARTRQWTRRKRVSLRWTIRRRRAAMLAPLARVPVAKEGERMPSPFSRRASRKRSHISRRDRLPKGLRREAHRHLQPPRGDDDPSRSKGNSDRPRRKHRGGEAEEIDPRKVVPHKAVPHKAVPNPVGLEKTTQGPPAPRSTPRA